VHIKSSFGGFPEEDLEEKLWGMSAGSFLELETTIDNVPSVLVRAAQLARDMVAALWALTCACEMFFAGGRATR